MGKWQEHSGSCSVTPSTVSPTSGGSVRRGFGFVVWFEVGRVGRIRCIWGAEILRSPCRTLLGWVGVCGIMRNTRCRRRRSGGCVRRARRRGGRLCLSKRLRRRGEGLRPMNIAIFGWGCFGSRCVYSAVVPRPWATILSSPAHHSSLSWLGRHSLLFGSLQEFCKPGILLYNSPQDSTPLLLRWPSG